MYINLTIMFYESKTELEWAGELYRQFIYEGGYFF